MVILERFMMLLCDHTRTSQRSIVHLKIQNTEESTVDEAMVGF